MLFFRKKIEPVACLCGGPAKVFQIYDKGVWRCLCAAGSKCPAQQCIVGMNVFEPKYAIKDWNAQIKKLARDPETIRACHREIHKIRLEVLQIKMDMKKPLMVLIFFCGLPYAVGSSYAGDDKTIYAADGFFLDLPTTSLCIGYDLRCHDTLDISTMDCEYVEGLIADQKKLTPLEKSLTFNLMPRSEYCGTLIPMTFRNEEKTCRYLLSEKWVCKNNGENEQ